jgi:hypothetical protein
MNEPSLRDESGKLLKPPPWRTGDCDSEILLAECFHTVRCIARSAMAARLGGEHETERELRAAAAEAAELLFLKFGAWAPSGAEIRRPN